MLDQIKVEEFEPLVGTTLRLSGSGDEYADLELAEAKALANPSPRAQAPFLLTLRENGAKRVINQGVYRLHHPTLGELDLFVVPIGPDAKGMCYEVTFN
jgi:hypothetical protein